MTSGLIRGAAAAALLLLSPVALADPPAAAPASPAGKADTVAPNSTSSADQAADKQDVSTLLFGLPQWQAAPAGTKLKYSYDKTVADASLGTSFKDEVVLTLGAGDDAQSRTIEMQLFSGAHRKPAGPFASDRQNPLLLVILEDNIQELSKIFKANPRYLKNAIRKAWRDNPKIGPARDEVDGKPVDVTRISVTPFVGDVEADRMKGLSDMIYTVDVAKDIPGYIVAVDMRAPAQGKPLFAETLRYASEIKP